jgi:two-component system cell cycle sensor histidine kinase/response regulator CckA
MPSPAERGGRRQKASTSLGFSRCKRSTAGENRERTRVEGQLQQLNRDLQARILANSAELTIGNADIGKLAAGIGHDFNNVLNVIRGYAGLIMSHSAEPSSVIDDAEVITATVDQGVVLARQLLAAGRKTEIKLELADINDVLLRTTQSLTPMFSTTTVTAADLDPRVPMIMIDAGLIYQAVLNLCINARDAMPDGGKILWQTRTTSAAVLRQRFPEARAEQYVYISVADTGVGMEADVRSRVFESYFTTKKPGQGTGLGLSLVRDIVSGHGGFIEVTSEPGYGSTFHIYLPIPEDEGGVVAVTVGPNNIEGRAGPHETVLYVEDEVRLSELMQKLLEREGFRVLTAQDGAEAVEVHARHKDEIAVAILDSGLANLNGWEAFQQMRKVNPKLKGILASGYVSAEAESRVAKGELCGVLQKPYAVEELLATIKRAIHSQ